MDFLLEREACTLFIKHKTFTRNVSGTSLKLKAFDFFVDCSIIDAKLIFVIPDYGT